MKKIKLTSVILVITLVFSAVFYALPVNAVEGYKEGDVIFLDYSAFSEWHTPDGASSGGINSLLYVNFNNNTRYSNGYKEDVVIGDDTDRFNPKPVTEEVDEYVYKYIVTAEDAGATTLMFWRGSTTNLWNNSVELTYEEFSQGKNSVVVTGWTDNGFTATASYFDYSIEAELSVNPNSGDIGDEFTVNLSCKNPIDADVTFTYEISNNGVKVSDEATYTFTADTVSNRLSGVITAYYSDGTVAGQAAVNEYLYLGEFTVVNSEDNMLYAHAFSDSGVDTESWIKWMKKSNSSYCFYMPSSADRNEVEIYSTFDSDITIDNVTISPFIPTTVPYSTSKSSSVKIDGKTYSVKFMNSSSEAALFVNNDFSKSDNLWDYLSADKSNSSSATSSIVDKDGTYETVGVKKIKGRGNTTWTNSSKKPFNINFDSVVTVGTMQSTKQYSLLANFQEPSLSRNRILYDLGDAVGLRYSSDSRFVDFYVDGVYKGQYQMCQKIEAGKKNLITGVADDSHLTDDNQLKDDFAFLIEVPTAEDFYTWTESGIDVCIKGPDVEGYDNLYAEEVKAYVREKFDAMHTALTSNDENLNDYIDVDSLAICYLIQELGKNWDTHSWYFVYEEDENGEFKFYASPVWDFDNSIGNAAGVASDLEKMNVTDYAEYSGWWCKYKNAGWTGNFSYVCTQNSIVMERAKSIWFERFIPAINTFSSNGVDDEEIFSADVYYDYLAESADMNYQLWTMTVENGWIANHTRLYMAEFDFETLTYNVNSSANVYNQNSFKGQYDYMADWLTSRAAWISNEWKDSYVPAVEILLGDTNSDGYVSITDATNIQKHLVEYTLDNFDETAADVNEDLTISIMDATIIQKYIAECSTDTRVGTYITTEK